MQFDFNSGAVFMIGSATNPTPDQIGILQSPSLDINSPTESWYGQTIFPRRGRTKPWDVTGKVKFAQYRSRLLTDFSGGSETTGQIACNEAATVPPTGPYTYQMTNHSTFTLDLRRLCCHRHSSGVRCYTRR
jgi:hypothetical protein